MKKLKKIKIRVKGKIKTIIDKLTLYKLINDLFTGEIGGIKTSLIIIEEFLRGEEASFICLVSGDKVIPLASSKDHKKLYNGDHGPNTGGMGAYSPTKLINSKISNVVINDIITPTLYELKKKL